ncbi:transcription intermediary factor 1-beta-like [Mytilus trossulus]|uniref:transcription intermediary factor 1-beta-like n=1 Tax=Mytilus trossulus TaxID=6551 RepID=UPI0030077BBF
MAQCPVRSCEICENSPGSRYCIDCEQFFCKTCEISHLKTKPCRNHIFQDADITNPEVKTPVCKQHGEKFTFYCNTCTSLTCNICLPTSHNKHDFCLIDDAASKARSLLEKELLAAEDSIGRAKEKNCSSRLALTNFEHEAEKAKQDVGERVDVILNVLYEFKNAYLKSIEEHRMKESQKSKKEILKIEKATKNYQEVLNKVKSSIAVDNNVILLDSLSSMTKTLKSVDLVSIETTIPVRIHCNLVSTKPEAKKLIGNLFFLKPNISIKEVARVNSKKPNTTIKVGDRVRVKDIYWSDVTHTSIGKVIDIQSNIVFIDFPQCSGRGCSISNVELAS